jgi:hypothetical protein
MGSNMHATSESLAASSLDSGRHLSWGLSQKTWHTCGSCGSAGRVLRVHAAAWELSGESSSVCWWELQ